MRLPEPPEGILDPQIPWSRIRPQSPLWNTLKARLTGRPTNGEHYSSYVNLTEADADRLIENLKKDPRGYPSLDQSSGTPIQWMERQQKYQEWLVEEYLEKPFQEQIDQKIEDRQAAQKIADRLNGKKVEKEVEQAVELTTDIIEDPWGEGTVPEKQPIVVPKTNLLPPAKEPEEEQKPETKKKKRSSLMKSMMKTFVRMESHLQKLIELSEVSDTNIAAVSDAFRIQSDTLTKGFQDTTVLITKVTQAVDLQTSAMARIATNKKQLDQKRLDTQESLNEEIGMEQQKSSSGTSRVKDIDKGPGSDGGGIGGSISKVLGGAVIGKFLAGRGLKLAQGAGGKIASKITSKALEKTVGKEVAETVVKNAGREAAEAGLEKGAAKFLGKKIPLVGLGLGTFFALERAAKGDFLGAGLELASGAASTIPGLGTAGSVAIDAALIARDSGAVPFAEGGLTRRSTFSNKRPGVTDLSPDLFKKMYQYELDYEAKNKVKFGRLYAGGYEKYFSKPSLPGILQNLLMNVIDFFKNISTKIGDFVNNRIIDPIKNALTDPGIPYESSGGQKITRSMFGNRGFRTRDGLGSGATAFGHTGRDVGLASGTPLSIVPPGVVVEASTGYNDGYGNFVVIKLDDGRYLKSNHHSQNLVKKGDRVGAGSGENGSVRVIAKVGSTGLSTGPHMHLDVGSGFTPPYTITGLTDPDSFILGGGIVTGGDVKAKKKDGGVKPKPAPKPESSLMSKVGETIEKVNEVVRDPVGSAIRGVQDMLKGPVEELSGDGIDNGATITRDGPKGPPPKPDQTPKRRAGGGPVIAKTPYMVGEEGPELFVPKENGTIVPNNQVAGLFGMFGGGSKGASPLNNPYARELELERIKKQMNLPAGKGFTGKYDQFGNPTGYGANAGQTEKLIAMAPLEEQIATSVQIIRVNNTNTVPIPMPSDSSDEAQSVGNIFKDLHLASIS
jgi:murein DD-endopeptidase MepM/ murein hydrolase activator NlpD